MHGCLYQNIRSVCFCLVCTFLAFYVTQTAIFHTLVCANRHVNNDRVCAFRFFVIYADSPEGTRRVTQFVTQPSVVSSVLSVEWSYGVFWFTNSGNLGTFYIVSKRQKPFLTVFPSNCHNRHFASLFIFFVILCVLDNVSVLTISISELSCNVIFSSIKS